MSAKPLSYLLKIAGSVLPALARGVATRNGEILHPALKAVYESGEQ